MKIAIGIDVHKEKCTAFAVYAGEREIKDRQMKFFGSFTFKVENC